MDNDIWKLNSQARAIRLLVFMDNASKPKTTDPRGNAMEKMIVAIESFFGAIGNIFRHGLTSPNTDSDTKLDHLPDYPQSELDAARMKHNFNDY